MSMRVKIDPEVCQGHAMCFLACPQIFQLSDEDGHAFVAYEEVPPEFEHAVDQAVRSCPEGAITTW
jgi:ferredoxin